MSNRIAPIGPPLLFLFQSISAGDKPGVLISRASDVPKHLAEVANPNLTRVYFSAVASLLAAHEPHPRGRRRVLDLDAHALRALFEPHSDRQHVRARRQEQ